MKNSTFLSALFFLLFQINVFSQNNAETAKMSGWQPVLNSHDGTNEYNGVVASYSLTNCNGEATLLLKLENKNNYALKASWRNLIQTQDGKDLYGTGAPVMQVLPPSNEVKGECGSNKPLVIRLSDFVLTSSDFKTFIAAEFEVIR